MEMLDESLPSDSRFLGQSMQNTERYRGSYPSIKEDDYEDDYEDYHQVSKFVFCTDLC